LLRGFSEYVPKRYINCADRRDANALTAESDGHVVHLLPVQFDVPGIGFQLNRLQIEFDHLPAYLWRQRCIANAHKTIIGENLNDQPFMKRERAHRSGSVRYQVNRIGAEMRRKRNSFALPAHNPSADFFDL